jgi:hypothetical protein
MNGRSVPKCVAISQLLADWLLAHAAALSAADQPSRSRRLIKCAKDSGHYPSLAPLTFAGSPNGQDKQNSPFVKSWWHWPETVESRSYVNLGGSGNSRDLVAGVGF